MAKPQYPQIVTFEEKHISDIYLIESPEDFHRIAVAKIRERHEYGYFGASEEEIKVALQKSIDRLIESCGIPAEGAPRTLEELEAFGEGTDTELAAKLFGVEPSVFEAFPKAIREQSLQGAAKYLKSLPRMISNSASELEEARSVELIVNSEAAEKLTASYRGRSYNLAEWILDGRRDGEYEGYEREVPRRAPSAEELEANRKK